MKGKKWTEFVAGIIMIISPWVLGFSDISVAKWCNVIIGLFLVLVNAWALGSEQGTTAVPAIDEHETKKRSSNKKVDSK